LEMVAARALFGWECPSAWKHVSRLSHAVAVDPFFDLFALLCIIANIVLLTLDNAHIDDDTAVALEVGNYVRFTGTILILLCRDFSPWRDVCLVAFLGRALYRLSWPSRQLLSAR